MSILLLFIGQLLVFGTYATDKQLKEVPETKQAIVFDNENTTSNDAVFAPPHGDVRTQNDVLLDTDGSCSEILHECDDREAETILHAERYNNSGEFETFVPRSYTNEMSSEFVGSDPEESDDDLKNNMTRQNMKKIESIAEKLASELMDSEHEIRVDKVMVDQKHSAIEDTLDTESGMEIYDSHRSQLDPRIADIRISNLKASVYIRLARCLESIDSQSGLGSWWRYIVLHDDSLQISRTDLKNIENSQSPGTEFLDLLDFNEYTLADIEGLFMRHGMEDALIILRSNQLENVVHVRKAKDRPNRESNAVPRSELEAENDHYCDSNPCKNEGTCIEEEGGYSCKCSYDWYSGKNCEKDDGPCKNFCFEPGTRSCVYNGPGGKNPSCVCNLGFDGDLCEIEHPSAKNGLIKIFFNICNERRLTKQECLLDAMGLDKSVDSIQELSEQIDNGDIKISTIFNNLIVFLGNLDLGNLNLGNMDLGNFGIFRDLQRVGVNKDSGNGHGGVLAAIEGYKQKLRQEHQHDSDEGIDEAIKGFQKRFPPLK